MRTLNLTDQECMVRIRAGSTLGFDVLFARYKREIYTYVYALVLNHEDAEDTVSQAFQKLWEKCDIYRGTGSVKGWLFKIARNEAFTLLRRRPKNVHARDGADSGEDENGILSRVASEVNNPRDVCEARELLRIINEAVRSLSAKCRCVYLLRWSGGLSYCEIAERLKIPLGTVKSRMDKATKHLSKRIGPHCQHWRELQCKRTGSVKGCLGS